MKKIILVLCVFVLVGCTTFFVQGCAEYRAAVGSYGQTTSDATLHDALWTICKAIPVGAIKRRFDTVEKLVQYNAMCKDQNQIILE